jgi:hypothetical protein
MEFTEVANPGNSAANHAYLWVQDNGSGKSILGVRFGSGAGITLATEP